MVTINLNIYVDVYDPTCIRQIEIEVNSTLEFGDNEGKPKIYEQYGRTSSIHVDIDSECRQHHNCSKM